MLDKQIHIYSVDTSAFYNAYELKIHKHLNKLYKHKNKLYKLQKKNNTEEYITKITKHLAKNNKHIKNIKEKLYAKFKENKGIRQLNPDALNKYNIISVFESVLTRTLQIPENTISHDIMVVQTFFFDVIEDIILDGYLYNNEKYICFTASAGQIRTKKTVFIKESVWLQHQKSLMCGLTIKDINKYGGVNINKFLAYLALCNSATEEWLNFDITKSIVVDDMETVVKGVVDFISDKTYEIARQEMDIPICHTDGCGLILPSVSRKNFMVRLPWIKGLLTPFPFDNFIAETEGSNSIVKDIYGQEHDIIKEGIEIIFTKSQFKMYKYYKDWQQYVDNFKLYSCQAGKCNEDEDEFVNKKINYQMLQTLSDMTEEELETICKKTLYDIKNIGSNKRTMLKVFGVTRNNKNKTYFQQALELYPNLISDAYTKEILRQIKKSIVKDGRAGKVEILGTYTFLIPDMYSFCEYLFLGNKNPKGLLKDKEVYCQLYKGIDKLDCLRSPHLFIEHSIRNNVIDETKNKWFITNGLYTSCHDLISKILQFDNDGDKSLVVAEKTIVDVAERNMQGVVPLYYKMSKSGSVEITNQMIYNGLKFAYTGGNIGMISNDITKIWNSDNINLDVIKLLCMENNFTIDYAKTLYKPERPKHIKKLITGYTKFKTPHFFIYVKDKTKDEVEKINNSTVNKLTKIIYNPNINFKAVKLDGFDYKMLMKNKKVFSDNNIINKYKELDLKKHFSMKQSEEDEYNNSTFIYQEIRNKILEVNDDIYYVVDVLVQYLYHTKKSKYKESLWQCFGDVLVENIKYNVKEEYIYCEKCGVLTEKTNNKIKYCSKCAKEMQRHWQRESMKKARDK